MGTMKVCSLIPALAGSVSVCLKINLMNTTLNPHDITNSSAGGQKPLI